MESLDGEFFCHDPNFQTHPIFHFDKSFQFVRGRTRSVSLDGKTLLPLDFALATSPTTKYFRSTIELAITVRNAH